MGVVIPRPDLDRVITDMQRKIRNLEQRAPSSGGGSGPTGLYWGQLAGLSCALDASAGDDVAHDTGMVISYFDFTSVATDDPTLAFWLSGQCVLSDPGATSEIYLMVFDGDPSLDDELGWGDSLRAAYSGVDPPPRFGVSNVLTGLPKHPEVHMQIWGSVTSGTAHWSVVTLVTATAA